MLGEGGLAGMGGTVTVTMQMCLKTTLKENPPAFGREESVRALSTLR